MKRRRAELVFAVPEVLCAWRCTDHAQLFASLSWSLFAVPSPLVLWLSWSLVVRLSAVPLYRRHCWRGKAAVIGVNMALIGAPCQPATASPPPRRHHWISHRHCRYLRRLSLHWSPCWRLCQAVIFPWYASATWRVTVAQGPRSRKHQEPSREVKPVTG